MHNIALYYNWSLFIFLSWAVALMGLALIIYALFKAPIELRLFIIFAVLIFATALLFPLAAYPASKQWPFLAVLGSERYWFIPMIAFITILIWLAGRPGVLKIFAMTALVIMILGIYEDWRITPFLDYHFKKYALSFETAPKGSKVTIPYPSGPMTLVKH